MIDRTIGLVLCRGIRVKTNNDQHHPEKLVKLLDQAIEEFTRDGKVTKTRCDVCGGIIEVQSVGEAAFLTNCKCGRFKDTLRGI